MATLSSSASADLRHPLDPNAAHTEIPSLIPESQTRRKQPGDPATAGLAPALLADATWHGTLAAARDLGAHGVPVTLATDALTAPARWSRYVQRSVPCPSTKDAARFLDWLLGFGRSEPRHVLYPTSDESAWLCAANAEALSESFYLYSPPLATLVELLDKARLSEAALRVGLPTPETRAPANEAEVERFGRALGFPVYVKPRTQVLGLGLGKGACVEKPEQLLDTWRAMRRAARFDAQVAARIPNAALPILQACRGRAERIYTVDGFIDETGDRYSSIACTKLLQRPRGSGAGIVFEHTALDPVTDDGLRRLLKSTGFCGVFDAEFVEREGQQQLIDLNPRFYNHMEFEVSRGLHLPWLAYLAATGAHERLSEALSEPEPDDSAPSALVHGLATSLLLGVQGLCGTMSGVERQRWRRFIAEHDGRTIDPVRSSDDRGPGRAELAMEIAALARHPRSFLKKLASR